MNSKGKVLITDTAHPLLIEGLTKLGYEVVYRPSITAQEAAQIIGEFTGIVVTTKTFLTKPVLEQAANLKFIARAGSGMENIDVAFAEKKKIRCFNSPEGNSNSVAEHATGLLISLYHHISKSFNEILKAKWNTEENRVHELEGQTIGIIGYGNTGSAFAKKLSVFGVTVLAYDKYKKDFSDEFARETTMDEIFSQSDVLSLHVPLTQETTHLVNRNFIDNFKKPIHLLNTSRGKVVHTADLVSAVKRNKIISAALDVLENEKLETYSEEEKSLLNELINSGEIIITPHIAGKSFESRRKFAEILLRKIEGL